MLLLLLLWKVDSYEKRWGFVKQHLHRNWLLLWSSHLDNDVHQRSDTEKCCRIQNLVQCDCLVLITCFCCSEPACILFMRYLQQKRGYKREERDSSVLLRNWSHWINVCARVCVLTLLVGYSFSFWLGNFMNSNHNEPLALLIQHCRS